MQAGQKMQVWGAVAVRLVSVRWGPKRPSERGLTKRGSQESAGDGAPAEGSAEEGPDGRGDTSLYGQ